MHSKGQRAVGVLLVASLVLAFLAQYYLANKRPFMWDGLVLYAVAMLAFARVVAVYEGRPREGAEALRPSVWQEIWQALRCNPARLVVLALGVLVVVYITVAARTRPGNQRFWDLLILWGAGIALALGAFVDWAGLPKRLSRLGHTLVRPGPEFALVALLAIATFLIRVINLDGIPFVLSGDEASMGLEAIDVLKGGRNSPFVTGWLSHPTLYFFMQAAFLRLFGITTAGLRFSSALVSGAIAVFLYLFTRRYYGRWVAILALLFFTAYHYAIHFGRLAINNIWDPFFALGAFYFLTRGLEERRLGHVLAAGVLTGLAIYFYMGSRLIPIMLVVYLAYWALREGDFLRKNLVYLGIFGLLAFLVALPLLDFFRAHPNDMMARWSSMGIFPSGWVAQQVQAGRSQFSVLLEQFLKAVLAYNYYPDPTYWYHPGIPLLHFSSAILFVFGLSYAVLNGRKKEYFLLVIWFLLVAIFGGALLENPPTSPRLVLSIPPVMVCVALGAAKLSAYVQRALRQPRTLAVVLSLALILFGSYQSLHFYYAIYTPSHEFAGLNTEVADRMGKYLRGLGPAYQCYFYGPPRIYYGHATIPFLAQGVVGTDVPEPTDNLDFVNRERKAVFIFLPERAEELNTVRRFYPTGLLREFRNQKGEMLFISYEATD